MKAFLSGTILFFLTLFSCNNQIGDHQEDVSIAPRPNEFVVGDAGASVSMIVYYDFTCSYCQQLQRDVIDSIKTLYVDRGQLKLVYRLLHDPYDQDSYSILAAEATHCAGEKNSYSILNYLLSNNLKVGQIWDQTNELAALESLDYDLYRECLVFHKTLRYTQSIVDRNNRDQIDKTPTTFINGTKIVGIHSLGYFIDVIDDAIDKSIAISE